MSIPRRPKLIEISGVSTPSVRDTLVFVTAQTPVEGKFILRVDAAASNWSISAATHKPINALR